MRLKTLSVLLMLFALAGLPAVSNAAIFTYSGQDDGAATVGPFPNSAAAQASFVAAAGSLGALNTITFESQPVGYNASFTAAPGVGVALTGTAYGIGYSGISNITLGNLYGFNTTVGGSQWLGFPNGTAAFSFTTPTQSFGMYVTGVQTIFTSSLTIKFADQAAEVLNLPLNVGGGAQYFGFTDAGASITSVLITNLGSDAWGIDDVTYNSRSAVPLPASMLLLAPGLMGLAAVRKRFKK